MHFPVYASMFKISKKFPGTQLVQFEGPPKKQVLQEESQLVQNIDAFSI